MVDDLQHRGQTSRETSQTGQTSLSDSRQTHGRSPSFRLETSHQPNGRGLPRPLRQIPINPAPHTNNLTRSGHAPNNAKSLFDVESTLPLPTYDTAVGVGMPDDVTYDETTQTIYLGKGSWSNVSPAVWNYTVGGNSTIKSWVGYRRKKPKGRKSSPLDDIITTSWPTQWSRQFHELLVTLTHLIQLEAEQKELLEQIIAGEQLTKDELAFHGVQWPAENKDRKPHFPGDLF